MTTNTLTINKIEDREYEGECGECGRHGLRWIAVLSDGSAVGLECVKRVLGYRPAPAKYQWITDYAPAAEYNDHGVCYVLWQHKRGNATRETRNGYLNAVGGVRADWAKRGWL